ncbi:MAG: thiamine phosphate synthase [Zetaproteobacteria bacterium CG06_land_8_20_14_3_00_59_53]|nr:MAG: thiamine-phosphate diphosphorylase [Zetaproteobacteria bacterium CG2_30_59_37]PIO90452.1 MAG: thiamine phosphate synthase [Zetaproteobacteria bacterium CG23_combo_of_CG06-09_8_20_14_all_59_86]PIQ65923.1 MAG: thiamine phosphate synthase [Zetaproteobacteria bacterium CG11_big_fil_rev_8_21_14_0_20_59_439]PIU71403.1 MAG: thiamine phosphate synthase [Zetaproteobacteria bacterium CG06_land_8_20_14_3_00_59_53]PIU97659.1 MAG: thiamine phosphate synthase [Zetaproteobacteria bacterium CG03_land_8
MTNTSRHIDGIYGILPNGLETAELLRMAGSALKGGVKTLQLRDKGRGYKESLKRARALCHLTKEHGARFIVNDSLQLACESEADGVHLGREDMLSIAAFRPEIGDEMIVGISCQADAAFARHVLNEGADYISFGAIFATATKQEAIPIGLPRLAKARQIFPGANICAIGGLTLESLPAVRKAGADFAAVVSSLFAARDIEAQARIMVETWYNAPSA